MEVNTTPNNNFKLRTHQRKNIWIHEDQFVEIKKLADNLSIPITAMSFKLLEEALAKYRQENSI